LTYRAYTNNIYSYFRLSVGDLWSNRYGEGARQLLCRSPHMNTPWPYLNHPIHLKRSPIMVLHLTEVVTRLNAYKRVIPHHSQGKTSFHHILHLFISLKFWIELWSANVLADTFLLHREDLASATLEHRRLPFKFIYRH